jgi:AbrB family looped-hinge helix DNA binding protein
MDGLMAHVFEIQVKSQGRIVIPSYVRMAANIKPGDWIIVQVEGRKNGVLPDQFSTEKKREP